MLVHALKQRHPTKHFMRYLGGNIVKDDSDTINDITNRSSTDFRYNDFYNKRRSERVLQVIKASINSDTHLNISNTQIDNTPTNKDINDFLADETRHSKPNGNKSTPVSTEDLMFLRQSNQIAEELKRIRSKGSKGNFFNSRKIIFQKSHFRFFSARILETFNVLIQGKNVTHQFLGNVSTYFCLIFPFYNP